MLEVSVDDQGVTLVMFDRPEKSNSLTYEFWTDIQALAMDAEADDTVRAVVVAGKGRNFCAGGDIDGFGDLADVPARRRFQEVAFAGFRAWERLSKPTIAAVHGYALGGGCELTMITDLVVADTTARFGVPEASVGLMPGLGVVRGPANTNLHWLKYMIYTGEHLSGEEARLAGLVNLVVDERQHLEKSIELGRRIAGKPATALRVAKRILNRGSDEGYDYSLEATSLLHSTEDQREGVAAFRDKRAPQFKDR
ncbi:enoyl-CoA hydratase/isomerase family protein [Actinomadura sp. 1N219]|uniref:enoyl-CoA hydratase/isomerase family protein n=1 Tax=Actinomadura sp. 1N219 TaxID=3375152 RepID=UPI0037975712